MKGQVRPSNLSLVFLAYLCWILLSPLTSLLERAFNFQGMSAWLPAALRMLLMLIAAWLCIRFYEKESLARGLNFSFRGAGRSLFWAFVFFVAAIIVLGAYQFLIVRPLTEGHVQASSVAPRASLPAISERLVEYLYVVFEGVIEVLVFIGFLLDRLAKRWGWAAGVIVSNVFFAGWHYDYLRKGLLEGTLMLILVFLAGTVISLSYLKTKNSLSPIFCHTLVDSVSEVPALLGLSLMS